MSLKRAIPGQSGAPSTPPQGEVDKALAAIEALDLRLRGARFLGLADGPDFAASWCAHRQEIVVLAAPALWSLSVGARHVCWGWRLIYETDDWYETGWMPDNQYHGLTTDARRLLWRALNPRALWRYKP